MLRQTVKGRSGRGCEAPQLSLEHLVARVERERVDDPDRARRLEAGHLLRGPPPPRLTVAAVTGRGHNERSPRLTHALVGDPYHRRLGHPGVSAQHPHHLDWVDVEAPPDDHALLTVGA